ncbi:sigma 54-interacting transcriptional regulator, partial [Thermodesulfobacteriota bacterium]
SFTGAGEDHKGFFESAEKGTIFLDEIGDVPLNVQANLLRVLQEREVVRLGETKPRKIDVRILAATNRDLNVEVEKGNFRADLLYRIRVARIRLPSLRRRREDIPLLVAWFLGQSRAATGKPVREVSQEAMRVFMAFEWPGNVRELKSAIEFAVIQCKGPIIHPEDLPPEIVAPVGATISFDKEGGMDEKERILAALMSAGGNRARASRLLGISRATLYRHLKKFDIESSH